MSFTRVRVGVGCCRRRIRSDSVGDIERSDGPARVGIASWNHSPGWRPRCHSRRPGRLAYQRSLDPLASISQVTNERCCLVAWQDVCAIWMRNFISPSLLLPLSPPFCRIVELHPNLTWLVILQETTRLNWTELVDLTQRFDPEKVIAFCVRTRRAGKKKKETKKEKKMEWAGDGGQLGTRRSICIHAASPHLVTNFVKIVLYQPLLHNRLFMDFSLLSSPIKTCLYTLKSCIIIGMVHRARTIRPRGDDCPSFRIPPRPVSFQISAFGSWYITKPASCQKVSYLSWLCDSQQLKCRWMLIDLALILSAGSIRE